MKRKNKIWMLGVLATVIFTAFSVVLAGCSADKDKSGIDDRVESQGTYYISVPGYEDIRQESITISSVKDEFSGTLNGSIYASSVDKTFSFTSQQVTMYEYEGNIWYAWVKCTDGVTRRVYFRRTGLGSYLGSGSVSIGVDVLGSGGSVGAGWSYAVYNEYGRITYCIYDIYTYTK